LPYLRYCSFIYIITEHELFSTDEFYEKAKTKLKDHQALQKNIAAAVFLELMSYLYKLHQPVGESVEDSMTLIVRKSHSKVKIGNLFAKAIKFNYYTGRVERLATINEDFPSPPKQRLKSVSLNLYNLRLKDFLLIENEDSYLQHRGWMAENPVPFYLGLSDLGVNRLEIEAEKEVLDRRPVSFSELEEIFSLVPYSVSIPLFSFTLFSVFKFFYSKYPSRISVQNSYKSVKGNIKKLLYLSLEGRNKEKTEQIAQLYCGSFSRHSLPGTASRRNEQKYVHDGIAIYADEFKKRLRITNKNFDSYIVKDACALFVNLRLPTNSSPIRIMADETNWNLSKEALDIYCEKIDSLLRHFIKWTEKLLEHRSSSEIKADSEMDDRIWKEVVAKQLRDAMEKNVEFAKQKLNNIPCDSSRKEKCVYLLSAFSFFIKYFANYCGESDNGKLYRLMDIGIAEVQRVCRSNDLSENMTQIFSRHISNLLEKNLIVLIRTKKDGHISGWFDPKRNAVLLPYESYYAEFQSFCEEKCYGVMSDSKSEFQSNFLDKFGFIQLGLV